MTTYAETEARTKWCPFVRVESKVRAVMDELGAIQPIDHPTSVNREVASDRICCIGSQCMAWQWAWKSSAILTKEEAEKYKADPTRNKGVGFCGMMQRTEL